MSAVTIDVAIPAQLEDCIRRKVNDLKMLPAIAMQALEIAKDPNCSIGEFSALIERDVKLASDILAMANSAMFSSGTQIISLHQAVVRLGFRYCKNLIISSSMTALMKKMTLEEEWIRELLWRHGFVTAMLGMHLNRALNVGFQGEEFTAGLIHDFGRTLLAVSLPERFSEIDPLEFDESVATLEHERLLIGTDHCEVGAWFAQMNQLPEPLQEAIRFHHEPALADSANRRLVTLTAACDHMANHIQRHDGPDGYDPQRNEAISFLEAVGVRDARQKFQKQFATVMEASAKDAMEMMAG